MNIVFDVDDTMYDLMEPFRMAHERYFADRTMADCAGLFDQSRIYSDVILEQERQGIVRSEDAFFRRIQRTYQDAGIDVTREESDRFEKGGTIDTRMGADAGCHSNWLFGRTHGNLSCPCEKTDDIYEYLWEKAFSFRIQIPLFF